MSNNMMIRVKASNIVNALYATPFSNEALLTHLFAIKGANKAQNAILDMVRAQIDDDALPLLDEALITVTSTDYTPVDNNAEVVEVAALNTVPQPTQADTFKDVAALNTSFNTMLQDLEELAQITATTSNAAQGSIDTAIHALLDNYNESLVVRTKLVREFINTIAEAQESIAALHGNRSAYGVGNTAEARALEVILSRGNPMHNAKYIKDMRLQDNAAALACLALVKKLGKSQAYSKHLGVDLSQF